MGITTTPATTERARTHYRISGKAAALQTLGWIDNDGLVVRRNIVRNLADLLSGMGFCADGSNSLNHNCAAIYNVGLLLLVGAEILEEETLRNCTLK